jgi:ornithine decarboxylase
MDSYFNEIKKGLDNLKLEKLPEIICEPGRALVAESGLYNCKSKLKKKTKTLYK